MKYELTIGFGANMDTHVHTRDESLRPSVELEPSEHPLAIERAMEFHF
jgi:hypothetical protein